MAERGRLRSCGWPSIAKNARSGRRPFNASSWRCSAGSYGAFANSARCARASPSSCGSWDTRGSSTTPTTWRPTPVRWQPECCGWRETSPQRLQRSPRARPAPAAEGRHPGQEWDLLGLVASQPLVRCGGAATRGEGAPGGRGLRWGYARVCAVACASRVHRGPVWRAHRLQIGCKHCRKPSI
jgi:hypothetical protein